MLELAGTPVINNEDYNQRDVSEFTPSLGENLQAAFQSNYALNPFQQSLSIGTLRSLEPGPVYYTDRFGTMQPSPMQAIDLTDPMYHRMTLEEANDQGKDIGLRFSEPPTRAQFDYLAETKRKENSLAETLGHAPLFSVRGGLNMAAGLAASAADPLNLAVSFVPVVGEARYARMIERFGTQSARLFKGAIEGGVGTAAITPVIYAQAQTLQQNYDASQIFNDIILGAALGGGLHWAGGAVADLASGRMRAGVADLVQRLDPSERWVQGFRAADRREGPRIQEGDNAARVEAMTPDERANVLRAAVSAVENDTVPKVDELLAAEPRLRDLAIADRRFPATVKLRSDLTAADYATGNRATSIIDMATARALTEAKLPATPAGLFQQFTRRFKSLKDWSLKQVPPAEFGQRVAGELEHPGQRVATLPATRTILATEGATLGAVRHEIERALDTVQKIRGGDAGGYRYRRGELDQINAHRAAMAELTDQYPQRNPGAVTAPRTAVEKFSSQPEPILNAHGREASDAAWQHVEQDKDRGLERMIADEEIGAVEDVIANIQGAAKDLGIMDKVIPVEERQILMDAATRAGKAEAMRDLFGLADEAAATDTGGKSVSDTEILMKAGPEKLAEIIRGDKTTAEIVAATELVTRVTAARSIRLFLGKRAGELTGPAYEKAIALVQAGEDIDKAVQAATEGGELLAKAEAAAAEPAPAVEGLQAPGETPEDLWGDIAEEATAILDANKIADKRDLADAESRMVREEHAVLDANPKTRDLFSSVERTEFDEADRSRALREGETAVAGGETAGAGGRGTGLAHPTGVQAAVPGRDGETIRGAGLDAEREGAAPGGERSAPATARSYGAGAVVRRVITPDNAMELSIEPRIVELGNLIHAEGDLQVRDRSRKESAIEARDRALKLDPEQLLPNRVADTGAPIVYANGDGTYTIISGNGRVLSLRQVYGDETMGGKAVQYRQRLGEGADGYRRPVLVSLITDQLSRDELVRFAERANRSRTAQMSVTEKAQRDANAAGIDIMTMYQGGDFTKKENQPFLRAFMLKAVTAQERGEMSKNGVLTKPGADRLAAAVLASAYDDTGRLSLMLESADNNVKSIASAYRDVAPVFMKLRAEIASGLVREEMDITAFMMEAIGFVQKAREDGVKIADALAQIDVLHPMDPVVDKLIRQFYNPQLTRANSSLRIAENLRLYAETARQKRLGGFLEDTTTPLDVIGVAERQAGHAPDEALLAADEENLGRGAQIPGREVPQQAPAATGPVADLGGARRGQEAANRPAAQAGSASLD